jgi:hypothetical protein
MSSISRHDKDCNAVDVVPGSQTTDPTLTNVDMADPTVQTKFRNDVNPPRTKHVRLRWMSTAPTSTLRNGIITTAYPVLETKATGWTSCYPANWSQNWTWNLVHDLRQNTNHQQVLVGYSTHHGILLDVHEESLFWNLVENLLVSRQPESLFSFLFTLPGH